MRILDAFCCAGGSGYGYHLAGFDVVGVDIESQPNYPFEFVQGDAIAMIRDHGANFDAIHASPPCQAWSPLNAYNKKIYPELIGPTRDAILSTGRPYIIENVPTAAHELIDPILLCGPMFNLKVYRHRLFETSFQIEPPEHPEHKELCQRNGYEPTVDRPFMTISGGKHSRAWQRAARDAMETPWMETIREVCEAIPPAYTRWIGQQFLGGRVNSR